MFKLNKKAQVALEALVIFGVLAIGTIIFGLFFVNNIREAFTSAPGAKQDRNTGGDVYDNIEGSLIYNEEQQIGSSSFGIIGGGGNTGSGGDDIDPPISPFCGDGMCDLSETPITCPQDCSAGYYNNLILTLIPPTFSQQDQDFNIKVSLNTDQSNMIIKKLIIKDEFGINTENCQYDGDYRSIFENLGTLEESETPELYTLTKQFSCNSQGSYTFNFTISPQDNLMSEITSSIEKEIREPLSFISTWDTTKTSYGSSFSDQISLPLISYGGIYNFWVDWGDGTTSNITSYADVNKTHTYTTPGIYVVEITGTIKGFKFHTDFQNFGDAKKIINISQWGPLNLGDLGDSYFDGASNLTITANDVLDLNGTTRLSYMFKDCSNLSEISNIEEWDMSNVEYTTGMFEGASSFNQPLNDWDVSNVKNMIRMFSGASSFNQPLNNWDVSNVTNINQMFSGASSFNQPLNDWNVSTVYDFRSMFSGASSFNQPLNDWNVSNASTMDNMFTNATSFNQPLNDWNVSKVTSMSEMFKGASSFNQPLNDWNVSKVNWMSKMFSGATSFNQNINDWDVSKVIGMSEMFKGASSFNQPLNDWNVSKVTTMQAMLSNASSFNQPLNDWNVSKVTNMAYMFSNASSFNQPLNDWNVSKVTNTAYMFSGASSFNQPLNDWNVSKVTDMSRMFSGTSSFNQNISSWNVEMVNNWSYIFYYCPIEEDYKPEKFRE